MPKQTVRCESVEDAREKSVSRNLGSNAIIKLADRTEKLEPTVIQDRTRARNFRIQCDSLCINKECLCRVEIAPWFPYFYASVRREVLFPRMLGQALAPPLRCHMAVSVEIASHNVYLGSALYLVEKPRS